MVNHQTNQRLKRVARSLTTMDFRGALVKESPLKVEGVVRPLVVTQVRKIFKISQFDLIFLARGWSC